MADKKSVFTELFDLYHPSLVNHCTSNRILKETAEDIVSEVYARALAKADKFLSLAPAQQKAWLFTAVELVAKEHYNRRTEIPFSEIEDIEKYINENDDLSVFQSNEDFQDYLQQVYDSLTDDCEKKLFTMIVEQKMDYKSISQVCRTSHSATRTMVSRFRKRLRENVNKILNS